MEARPNQRPRHELLVRMASLEGVQERSQSQKKGGGLKVFPAIERCNSARMESRLCTEPFLRISTASCAYKAATLSACPA